jgi:mycothiol synthase
MAAEGDVPPGVRPFEPGDEPAIQAVIDAALPVDRFPGVTRQETVHAVSRLAGDPEGTIVAVEDGVVVGYCTPGHDDITVHPAHRRRGHGRRLIAAALELVRARGLAELILYGPSDHEAAAGFIDALGFEYRSSLWMFELAPSVDVPEASFPDTVSVRPYRDPADLAAYVALANASFADHPRPMHFTEQRVRHVHGLTGFDPADILLAASREEPAKLVGWIRTEHEVTEAGARRGHVLFIGVVPEWRRAGLGQELLRWGIARMRSAGAEIIELKVEAANDRALGLYRRAGFEPKVEWPHYALPAG